ncbi:MAG: Dabb family protein [Oscillospiraceae bacterium]
MVRHVLFCKLTNYSQEGCEKLRDVFLSMNGKVPMAREVNAHIDFLHSDRSFDVLLEVTLDSPGALDAYQQDPYHCNTVKTYVHSVVGKSAAVDYQYENA